MKRRLSYEALLQEIHEEVNGFLQEGESSIKCSAYERNAKIVLAIYDGLRKMYVHNWLLWLLVLLLSLRYLLR